jgi:hypothetical protein
MSDHHEIFLTRLQQAKRWNVTKRSVERWGEDEDLGLPPEIEIYNRRYRKLSELEAWERSRAVPTAAKQAALKHRKEKTESSSPI